MRRLLLSGLGLALGISGRPALAQKAPTRAAQLGRPIAMVDPARPAERSPLPSNVVEGFDPNDNAVTPAGLFSRSRPATSTSQQMPTGSSLVPSVRPNASPVPGMTIVPGTAGMPGFPTMGQPITTPGAGTITGPGTFVTPGMPVGQPLGDPRPMTGVPSITEMHDTTGLPKPMPLGAGTPVGPPTGVVTPDASGALPLIDDPMFGGSVPEAGAPTGLGGFFRTGPMRGPNSPPRYYVTGEYLMWWTRNTSVPVLATTTSVPGSDAFIGTPGTVPVIGGGNFGNNNPQSGFRIGGGWWFSDCQVRGVDARLFFLEQSNTNAFAPSNVFPVLTRPFFNLNAGIPFGEAVAFPGFAAGAVAADLQTSIWGAEINYRRRLGCGTQCSRLDALVGFRYFNLKDQLSISESFISTGTTPITVGVPGVVSGVVTDQFRTENNFYGGQIGLAGEVRRGRWFVDSRATIAFGSVQQSAQISGAQNLVLANGGIIQSQGGLLTAPGANIGTFSQNKFAVMPEIGVNLGYHITPHLRAFVGYNFLYLSSVLRAGEVVDTNLDVTRIPNFPLVQGATQLPGTPRPAPLLRTTDFVAQGINFGLSYTW